MMFFTNLSRIVFLSTVLFYHSLNGFSQTKEKIVASDLTRIKQVGGIAVSPDGKRAVYTVTSLEPASEALDYEYRTHLWLVDLDGKTPPRAITRGNESASQPVWSPDGKSVAFVRAVKGKAQIFVMPLDGGEAWQLTDYKHGASGPQFSPDGRQILFSTSVVFSALMADSTLNPTKVGPAWSLEKAGFAKNEFLKKNTAKPNPDGTIEEIRAYLDKDVEDKKAKVINRLNFQGEASAGQELSFSHLLVIDVKEGAKPVALTKGFYSYAGAAWSGDNKQIWFSTRADSLLHPDRDAESRICVMNADGSGMRTVLVEKGRNFGQPTPSPDGQWLAFITSQAPVKSAILDQGHLGFLNLKTTAAKYSVNPFDRSPGNLKWVTLTFPKNKKEVGKVEYVYFTASSNGGAPLFRAVPTIDKVEQLSDFDSGVTDFDVFPNKVVFAKTEVANPSELYQADVLVKNAVKLSTHNDWVSKKALSMPEKRTFKNEKGQTIEYWIMKPTLVEAGKKYPLLLNMHGGPTAMWGPGEASMWHEHQFFCAQGYGVVYANPRGSGGYGVDFMKANYRDWGTGPANDVLRACSDAAKETWADTSRQVITGGSYAGYLTAWIIAHDNRFKAAFAQRGVYDLTTFMGEGNAWRLVPGYFGGYPWETEAKESMDANSPYTFVDKIKTPFLIKHGENDLRTGVIQSEMMYKSLKILGREVEYVRMPGGTHELSRTGNPRQRIDRMLRIYEFFERYVGKH
ncbi:prolyl oligopeptidase family serine peptidase [Runella sp. CRIBMP]|uniref:S9 family peptidase n=1 Tax=Runella sp. CRIBMP TaxID=2683261 RepID=UPI001E4A12FC|nr:S9 family peptidase [Runella sp. CRIBMP]NBB21507.1 prolyl oligopeptidase family serine peptidase [Runella sp. CRIBMP]